jgi:PAS domain S-box-containing protein
MTQTNSNHKVGRLLIVDDESELLTVLCEILTDHGYKTAGYTSGAEALAKLKEQDFDLLLTDLMLPEMGGIELLQAALAIDPNIVGIVMTGQGTVQTAVEAMKTGAFDYILKPFNLNSLLPVLSRAMEVRYLRTENIQLRNTVAMHELGQALAFSSDLNQILNKVIDAVMQQCDADEASIMLPTSDGEYLIVAVTRGGHTEHIGKQIPMGQGIAGWVAQNRETVTLSGEVHDERFTLINPRADIRAAVSFPLLTRSNLVGVLNVNIIHSHRPFTLGQIKTLNMLATIVSPILENARLYAEKKRAEDLYRTLAEASLAVVFIVQDGKFRFINAAVKSVGYSVEETIGWNADAIVHPEDREMVKKMGREMLRGEHTTPYEYRMVNKQGEIRWLLQIVSPILYEDKPAILGNATDITELKKAEEALRNSQTRLHTLLQTIPDLIWLKDKDGVYLSCNTMFERFFGAREADIVGKTDYDFVDRELADSFLEHDRKAMAARKPSSNEEWITFADDGHRAFLETIKTPMYDAQGTLIGVLGIGRDISERKQAEEVLRIQNRTFSEVLNGLDSLVYVIDMKTYEIVFINTYGQNIWGDIKGKICWQTIQEGQPSPCEFCTNSQLIGPDGNPTKGVVWEFQNTVTKRWYDCRDKAIYWPDGRIVRMEIAADITGHKQAEEELRSYAAEISDLYNNAPCGYHSLGPDGTFLRMNDTELQWFGYARDEIIGNKNFSDIMTPKSRQLFQEVYPAFKERGWAGNLEFDVIRKDGTLLPVLLNATAVKDENGNYIMSRSTIFDNTERKRTEAELDRYREGLEATVGIRTNELALKNIELEKTRLAAISANQAKSDFLASMSHELRTPLNAIIGFSDVLLNAYFGALNEKQKEYTIDILESGKHLLNLINDVLDISKVEAGKMELELAPTEIGNLLASCVVMIKEKTHKHGIDLKVDIPEELLSFEMLTDQRKVKQIMFNLLSNAAKFTPEGGAITLSALRMLQEGNDVLEVSVTDTGMGIPPEYQEKIFESFYQIMGGLTDKTPGTGLGLSVAKQLVELHGGGIRLKSDGRGKGSRLSFTLPVKAIDEKTYHSVRKAKVRSKAKIDGA